MTWGRQDIVCPGYSIDYKASPQENQLTTSLRPFYDYGQEYIDTACQT